MIYHFNPRVELDHLNSLSNSGPTNQILQYDIFRQS